MAIRKLDSISVETVVKKSSELEKLNFVKPAAAEIKHGVGGTKDGFEANTNSNSALSQILPQLAQVEVQIKELLNDIQHVQGNEDQVQDDIKARQKQQAQIEENLQKAIDSQQQLLDATKKLDP